MKITPGQGEDDRKVELNKTEARQAGKGFNIYVLLFGLVGVILAFILVFSR
jgi:hypothetical protein